MTRLGSRVNRLEKVMVPANEEPIRIQVEYVDVNGEVADRYEVLVAPRPRFGFPYGEPGPQMSSGVVR